MIDRNQPNEIERRIPNEPSEKKPMKAYLYLRTSGDDGKEKAGLPVQREACMLFAARAGYEIVSEFPDDGVSGKLVMHARPQGKLLLSSLLGDGVKTVLTYNANR